MRQEKVKSMTNRHVAEVIQEELDTRGWTLDRLTTETEPEDDREWGIRRLALDFLMELGPTERRMTIDGMADYLAVAFDVPSDFFRNIEAAWNAEYDATHASDAP